MKQHDRRRNSSEFLDPDFAEALYESSSGSRPSDRQIERKARQLCRQVQQALNFALAEYNLFAEEVSPAPDCGRLLVHVFIPADQPVADAMSMLRREAPRLRSEVAAAITRKRAPELSFIPACPEGGRDE